MIRRLLIRLLGKQRYHYAFCVGDRWLVFPNPEPGHAHYDTPITGSCKNCGLRIQAAACEWWLHQADHPDNVIP